MKRALVTGATSGIGKAICLKLLELGYQVYGIGRDFSKLNIDDKNFIECKIDLLEDDFEKRLPKIENLNILVNSAGIGYFAPHEELSFKQISDQIDLNLKLPLLITNYYLKDLKKNSGYIFLINSVSAIEPAIGGAAYGASKAGLRHFGKSLFKEARKSGLKVININPNITKSNFHKNSYFTYYQDPLCYIEPKDIANIVEDILSLKSGTVVSDITIDTQIFRLEKKKKVAKN